MRRAEVTVVGGGPAGLATALTLRKAGLTVAVLRRQPAVRWHGGEAVPEDILIPLATLGTERAFIEDKHLESDGVVANWGDGDAAASSTSPKWRGWHIDRPRFVDMLTNFAQSRGISFLESGPRVRVERLSGGFGVSSALREEGVHIETDFLVDASGRARSLCRNLGCRSMAYDRLVAMVAVLAEAINGSASGSTLLVEASETGWCYSVPLPSGSMVVACMTDGDILRASGLSASAFWRRQLASTASTRDRITAMLPARNEPVVHVCRAETSLLDRCAGPGWLTVGDAAATMDPLSGHGIHWALQSGINAGRSLLKFAGGEPSALGAYELRLRSTFHQELQRRNATYSAVNRWSNSLFWQRRKPARVDDLDLSLDPQTTIKVEEARLQQTGRRLEGVLPLSDLILLTDLCRGSRSAYEVARSFRAAKQSPLDDRLVVLALQTLAGYR